jgi:hypothetical protein
MLHEVVGPDELGTSVKDRVWVTHSRDRWGRWNRRDDEPASLLELLRRDAASTELRWIVLLQPTIDGRVYAGATVHTPRVSDDPRNAYLQPVYAVVETEDGTEFVTGIWWSAPDPGECINTLAAHRALTEYFRVRLDS